MLCLLCFLDFFVIGRRHQGKLTSCRLAAACPARAVTNGGVPAAAVKVVRQILAHNPNKSTKYL